MRYRRYVLILRNHLVKSRHSLILKNRERDIEQTVQCNLSRSPWDSYTVTQKRF